MALASQKLEKYFRRIMGLLPESFVSAEPTSLLFVFFGTIGLDLISKLSQTDVEEYTDWVYDHQIRANKESSERCGFRGSSYLVGNVIGQKAVQNSPYDSSHVTMVYNALCILLTLGDDLSRVDRASVLRGISALQCADEPGLFRASLLSPERDMRFIYSAVASCFILDGLNELDQDAIISFIDRSYTYEGGFSQLPGLEAHAGATYCAVASLTLLDALSIVLPPNSRRRDRLIKWLVSLQRQGFHGRMHKPDDTCYTFWVCGSLRMTGLLRPYFSDPLHTYLCLSGLACLKTPDFAHPENPSATTALPVGDGRTSGGVPNSESGEAAIEPECLQALFTQVLCPIRPELNVGESTYMRLKKLHKEWRILSSEPVLNELAT
ncbi:Geranylgeranyl transferase type I beta subunit [Fasciola gigantica]|uniref:Geranylgeranyl transferase type I beta subunit n=1 Tax=Fasciola gigantica TaxID=46835 RepID=A0A504YH05_FASGI|nr:Geranylgeranyl transferase type I beta subunit [Fasciola gigantica]